MIHLAPGSSFEAAVDSDQETIYAPKRQLKGQPSDVSLDEQGFPSMLSEPSIGSAGPSSGSAGGLEPVVASAKKVAPATMADESLQQALGVQRPKEKPKAGVKRKVAEEPVSKKYTIMFYKNTNAYGLRQLFGDKRQIFSVCKKGADVGALESLAKKAKDKLEAGLSEEVVKAWVVAKVQALST